MRILRQVKRGEERGRKRIDKEYRERKKTEEKEGKEKRKKQDRTNRRERKRVTTQFKTMIGYMYLVVVSMSTLSDVVIQSLISNA